LASFSQTSFFMSWLPTTLSHQVGHTLLLHLRNGGAVKQLLMTSGFP
jgi:hypothetical protein